MIVDGDLAPDELVTTLTAEAVDLRAPGAPLVLFFYHGAETPASATLVDDFEEYHPEFDELGVRLMGVSVDGLELTAEFAAGHGLHFSLADDTHRTLCRGFGVLEHSGHHRPHPATFLIDIAGVVRRVFPSIPPYGHARDVLEAARELWA
jgi:thioredoxin-dependent peroxiredoxin